MSKFSFNAKGAALFLVLASLMVALILTSIVLNVILSQARLSHHQASRIQAYYAALAGANYAIDQLRRGNLCWQSGTHVINRGPVSGSCNAADPDLPLPIQDVTIVIAGTGPNNTLQIRSTATYTYIMP